MIKARTIAVIGASGSAARAGGDKLGTVALRHLINHGFPGAIYPVNPKETEIAGLPCYASLADIPGPVDLAVIAVPASACIGVMRGCVAKGVKAAVVLASGFAEAGNTELQEELVDVARRGGVRFCGPNTNGLISISGNMVACTSMVCAKEAFNSGDIAFITQSGAVGGSMLGSGIDEQGGFSHWISVGNEADLDISDYLDYLIDDPGTRVFALFIEGVRDPAKFTAACAKAAAAGKPVIVYKIGLSTVAAETSVSHTGSMVGSDAVFDAVCRKYGLIRVDDAAELLPTAITFSWLREKLPRGRNMGIIAPSGGICGVAADECHRAGLDIPPLGIEAQNVIRQFVPSFGAVRNPIDVTQQIRASANGFQETIAAVLDADNIDGLILLVTMVAEPRASFYAEIFTEAARMTEKPLIIAWTGPVSMASQGYPELKRGHVPTYLSARGAVKAMRALLGYQTFLAGQL